MDDSALTSRAAYERLNRAAARAETLVLYRLDMLSGCRDSLDVDQERLERSIQNLWRLTAVRKTLLSLEASLNAPTSTSTPPPDDAILQQLSENIDKALAEEAELEADDEDDDEAKDATPVPEANPSANPAPSAPCSSVSPSPSQSIASSTPSAETSHREDLSRSSAGSCLPPASAGGLSVAPTSAQPASAGLAGPASAFAPASLSIRAVPSCPKLTPGGATRMLGRVNADLANYPGGHTYTNKDYNFTPPLGAGPQDSTFHETHPLPEDAPLLEDPALSDNLKSQISNPKPSPSLAPSSIQNQQSAIRNSAPSPVSPRLHSLLDLKKTLDRHRPPD
jgi:hypothetical protein